MLILSEDAEAGSPILCSLVAISPLGSEGERLANHILKALFSPFVKLGRTASNEEALDHLLVASKGEVDSAGEKTGSVRFFSTFIFRLAELEFVQRPNADPLATFGMMPFASGACTCEVIVSWMQQVTI